jgi:hypothetical protein
MEPQKECCWPTRLRPRWVVAAGGVGMMTDPIMETRGTQAHMDRAVNITGDRPFDWVAALALVAGVAVVLPGMIALLINVFAVLFKI